MTTKPLYVKPDIFTRESFPLSNCRATSTGKAPYCVLAQEKMQNVVAGARKAEKQLELLRMSYSRSE